MKTEDIQNTIAKGVEFLKKDQEKDGSFMCLVSTVFDDYTNAQTVPAIVPPNIILSSLIHLDETPSIKIIKDRTAQFLLTQRGTHWSFNYWFKGTKEYTEIPYPDDLDDTFCALAALYEYDPDLFLGDVMGKIIMMLTTAEEEEGGPYDMWLVAKTARKKWHDIDLVVNSNIAFFLSLNGIQLPKLDAFIEKSIDEDDYEFPYNTIYPGIYFISRFYKGSKIPHMVRLLLSKKGKLQGKKSSERKGAWENPLRTALAISSLLNFSGGKLWKKVEDSIEYLIQSQSLDGAWPAYAFFYQMRLKEKTLFAGSVSTTTALCLEALDKFQKAKKAFPEKNIPDQNSHNLPSVTDKRKIIFDLVIKKIKSRFAELDPAFEKLALDFFAQRIHKDADQQIALLPLFFDEAIDVSAQSSVDKNGFFIQLGIANTYGWMAYDIYDDFLDGKGDPSLLSLANVCLRESYTLLNSVLPPQSSFADFSRNVFDVIDAANTWEVTHCHVDCRNAKAQLPVYHSYTQLAEKSLGHILGPVAILFKLGYKNNSPEVKNTVAFFKHYLIARQLNDDAHDWQEDLKNGYVNVVSTRIFSDMENSSRGKKRSVNFNLENLENMEQFFWNKTVISICDDILDEIASARKILKKMHFIKNPENLLNLLVSVEQSALKALNEQKETKKFLRSYAM